MDAEHTHGYPDLSFKSQTKLAPHSSEVEQFLLGALLWNADRFHDVAEIVEADAFYVPKHRHVFESMAAIAHRGDAIDSVTVGAHLEQLEQLEIVGGYEYLTELVEQSPSTAHVESYAKIIRDAHVRRRLQQAGTTIADLSVSTEKELEILIDDSEKSFLRLHNTILMLGIKRLGMSFLIWCMRLLLSQKVVINIVVYQPVMKLSTMPYPVFIRLILSSLPPGPVLERLPLHWISLGVQPTNIRHQLVFFLWK